MKPRLLNESDRDSQSTTSASRRPHKISAVLVSGVGFLADAYDLFVIDFVVAILVSTSYVEPTAWDKSLIVSSTLAGAVVGQLLFGIAADFLGRRIMFVTTAFLVICGSLLSSIVGWGYSVEASKFSVFHQLAVCRFFLGCGIGGEYPLSATVTAEHETSEDIDTNTSGGKSFLWYLSHKPNSIAAVFSMQGVGMLLSPLIVMFCVYLGLSLELTWRLCLCVGAIPSAIAFIFRWRMSETPAFTKLQNDYSLAESAATAVTSMYSVPYPTTPAPSSSQEDDSTLEYLPYLDGNTKVTTTNPAATTELISLKSKEQILAASFGIKQESPVEKNVVLSDGIPQNETQNILVPHNVVHNPRRPNIPSTVGARKKSWKAFGKHLKQCFWIISCLRIVLLGTSSTWFLIDVTLYGTGSFKSAIIADWFLDTSVKSAGETTNINFSSGGIPDGNGRQLTPNNVLMEDQLDLEKIDGKETDFSSQGSNNTQSPVVRIDTAKNTLVYRPLDFSSTRSWPSFQRKLVGRFISNTGGFGRKTTQRNLQDISGDMPQAKSSVRNDIMLQAEMGAIVALLAIPGYVLSIFFIHKVGTRQLQFWGFVAVALVFITLGLEQLLVGKGLPTLELILFGLTFLCSNFGPNTTTFILPTLVYPTVVRATCHGFSAAMGKLGGVFGTSFFSIVERTCGLGWLLFMCGVVSIFGAACTFLIPKDLKAKKHLIGQTMNHKIQLPEQTV